jgi:metacaspase-1
MNPRTRLTILFDCCHSGSAVELPFVYRPDSHGRVNLVDSVKQGLGLINAASSLLKGGISTAKIHDAQILIGGAKTFFHSLQHRGEDGPVNQDGLGEEHFVEDWKNEGKDVWMFSGCADDQTSADTSIAGAATGLCLFFNSFMPRQKLTHVKTRRDVLRLHQNFAAESWTELRKCETLFSPIHFI